MFRQGFYKDVYSSIVERSRDREIDPNCYYETHHILPSSLGGDNSKSNLVKLTAREHFICHYLLTKIADNFADSSKMIWAFHFMCVDPIKDQERRKNAANYELARKLFVQNHPTKKIEVVDKIRKSVLTYYASEKYLSMREKSAKFVMCKCNCGIAITYHGKSVGKFVNREHYFNYIKSDLKPPTSDKTRKKQSNAASLRLRNMTEAERVSRMRNSAFLCDHKERGNKISEGKKGKKTNQQEIMGKKYASMSDEDFKIFLYEKKRPSNIINRTVALRERYLERN